MAFIGDVNKDGFGDIMVAAPGQTKWLYRTTVGTDGTVTQTRYLQASGEVSIFLGSSAGVSQEPYWTYIDDDNRQDKFSLTAGDLNQDGFIDIVIGSPTASVGTGTSAVSQAGIVRVFLGSENGLAHDPSLTLSGTQTGGWFGNAVRVVGDVNGDEFPDLMIGAYGERSAEPVYAGRAYLYLGSTKGLSQYPHQVFEGDESQDRFGASIAGADVNNDGFADVVIGCPIETTRPWEKDPSERRSCTWDRKRACGPAFGSPIRNNSAASLAGK